MNQDFSITLTTQPVSLGQTLKVGPWTVQTTVQTTGASAVSFPHLGVTILMKGQVYGLDWQELAQRYREQGLTLMQGVQSACSAVILDELQGEVYTLTDPVGTHHLYARPDGQQVTTSTRADHPDFTSQPYFAALLRSLTVCPL